MRGSSCRWAVDLAIRWGDLALDFARRGLGGCEEHTRGVGGEGKQEEEEGREGGKR